MDRSKKFWAYTLTALAIGTFGSASVGLADEAAQQPIGKIISVKHSGYATRLQQSVKHSVKAGDTLYSGDVLDVKSGNTVQIALDSAQENIIHIQGDTMIQLTKDQAIKLELSRGKVFALLDKLDPGTRFKVMTPTAVTTVRGTYFQVNMIGGGTQTSVYRGEVGVNGLQSNGKALGAAIPVMAGQKTTVAHSGTQPGAPEALTAAEFEQINDVLRLLGGSKQLLSFQNPDAVKLGSSSAASGKNDIDLQKSKKTGDDEDISSGGKVVF